MGAFDLEALLGYKLYMPLLRKIVFYLLSLIYLIICPLFILRLLGFVWDPQERHWVKTGIIYVSSNPPGATVYLDGHRLTETTPTIIRDLTSGDYLLRMELAGYMPWENRIPVAVRKASPVENILLLPQQWKIRTFNSEPVIKLVPVPGNNFLLFATDPTAKNVWVLRLSRDIDDKPAEAPVNPSNPSPLFPEESIYRDAQVVRYYTVNRSPFFIMEITVDEKSKYLWIDPRDRQIHTEDISDLLPQAPEKFYWEPNDDKNIFVFYPGSVNRLNIKEKAIYPNIRQRDIPVERIPPVPPAVEMVPKADQAFWANNDNTIIFRIAKDVFLMDTESFGQPRLAKVMHVQENSDVYFDEYSGRLYYIDDKTNLLSSVQILHHKPFIPKPIADTLKLKQLEE